MKLYLVHLISGTNMAWNACLHHLKAVTFCSLGQKIQLFCHKVFTSRKFHALFCKWFRRFFTFLVQQPDHTRLGRAAKMRTVVTVISLLTTRMTTLTKLRWRTENDIIIINCLIFYLTKLLKMLLVCTTNQIDSLSLSQNIIRIRNIPFNLVLLSWQLSQFVIKSFASSIGLNSD